MSVEVCWKMTHRQQIMSITCDNASSNTVMLDELKKMLPYFPGRRAHVRCFTHTVNLTAKGILQLFEAAKSVRERVSEGGEMTKENSPNEDGLEELYAEIQDLEDHAADEKDYEEGFVAVMEEMTAEEREEWEEEVIPVKSALYKVYFLLRSVHFPQLYLQSVRLPQIY